MEEEDEGSLCIDARPGDMQLHAGRCDVLVLDASHFRMLYRSIRNAGEALAAAVVEHGRSACQIHCKHALLGFATAQHSGYEHPLIYSGRAVHCRAATAQGGHRFGGKDDIVSEVALVELQQRHLEGQPNPGRECE